MEKFLLGVASRLGICGRNHNKVKEKKVGFEVSTIFLPFKKGTPPKTPWLVSLKRTEITDSLTIVLLRTKKFLFTTYFPCIFKSIIQGYASSCILSSRLP